MVECSRCNEIERALEEARADRDRILLELARERERQVPQTLPLHHRDVPLSAVEGAPLRYMLADQLNDRLKAWLGPLHARARRLLLRFDR